MSTDFVKYKDIVKQMDKDLESFFNKYDSDRNKKITRSELVDALNKQGSKNSERIADLILKNDTNKDGELSIDEVKKRIARMRDGDINRVLDWDVEKFLKENDKDGDKRVTKDEVISRFEKSGALDPNAIANAIFRQMDKNNDGYITTDEIREFNKQKKFKFLDSSAPSQ